MHQSPEVAQQLASDIQTNFTSLWTIYISFYTAFLGFNAAGLGLTLEKVRSDRSRRIITWAFILQNVLSAFTAMGVAFYSGEAAASVGAIYTNLDAASAELVATNGPFTPVPGKLAMWGGVANAFSHAFFIACWIAVGYGPTRVRTAKPSQDAEL